MKHAFIIALSVLAVSAAGIEVKARAQAPSGANTNAQVKHTTGALVKQRAETLFQCDAGGGINSRLSPQVNTEPADEPITIYCPEIELGAPKPVNVVHSQICPHLEYSGSLVQAVRSNPLQLINPFAPAAYADGQANVVSKPGTKRAEGLKLLQISF